MEFGGKINMREERFDVSRTAQGIEVIGNARAQKQQFAGGGTIKRCKRDQVTMPF